MPEGVDSEVGMISLTVEQLGDVWNRMTPIERERLALDAGLEFTIGGSRWLELWPQEKRAIRRAYERRHSEPVKGQAYKVGDYIYDRSELSKRGRIVEVIKGPRGDNYITERPNGFRDRIFIADALPIQLEVVKGEQAGMLGVPGKYVEQKRPWTPGQMGFESYAKYIEAMDRKYSLAELRELCRQRGLSASGDKKTLVRRLF